MVDYIQKLFDQEIPIAHKMGITVESFKRDEIILKLPIENNTNPKNTAFAGSIYSGLVLSGWGLIVGNLKTRNITGLVVIHEGKVRYDKPINSDFEIHCKIEEYGLFDEFINKFKRVGRSKIVLNSMAIERGETKASFDGKYVLHT